MADDVQPGYYDVSFDETVQEIDEDGAFGPEVTRRVEWPMARVLMRDGDDYIVEHAPVGYPKGMVLPRIDRVPPEYEAVFTPVKEVPDGI